MKQRILLASLIAVAAFALVSSAHAQTTQTLVSFRDGSITQAVATPRLQLHVGKAGFAVDTWGFGGYGFTDGKVSGGGAISHRFDFAREAFADLGLYARFPVTGGGKIDGGLFVGIGFRL